MEQGAAAKAAASTTLEKLSKDQIFSGKNLVVVRQKFWQKQWTFYRVALLALLGFILMWASERDYAHTNRFCVIQENIKLSVSKKSTDRAVCVLLPGSF